MARDAIAWAAAAVAAAFTVIAAAAVAGRASGRGLGYLTTDPAAAAEEPLYLGAVSQIAVLGWWTGCVAALVGWLLARSPLLLALGALTGWLALDDLLLVHEQALPDHLGIPQQVVVAAYAFATGGIVLAFRPELAQTEWPIAALALAAFAVSLAVDLATDADRTLRYAAEDGAKLAGVLLLALYLVRTTISAVSARR